MAVNGTGNGSSLSSPLGTIQAGINNATDGNEVILADGIYYGSGNVNLTFSGKKIIIRSYNSSRCSATIDCQTDPYTYAFVANSGETFDSILQTLTITRCYRPIQITNNATLQFNNVRFLNNQYIDGTTSSGGVLLIKDGGSLIKGCSFEGNDANNAGVMDVTASNTSIAAGNINQLIDFTGAVVENSRLVLNRGGRIQSSATAVWMHSDTSIKLVNTNFISNKYLVTRE